MLALYGHPFSSYTWKAIIPLYANETPFEFREVSPDHPEHAMFIGEAHPAGKFPVLDDGGTVVVEATSIVEYLAVHHPGPAPLLPTDPAAAVAARERLLRAYRWLERWLSENTFPPHVSLVTCAGAPSLFYADWVERIPEDCPRLAALRAELLALPPVVRCVDDARPYRAWFPPGAPDRD